MPEKAVTLNVNFDFQTNSAQSIANSVDGNKMIPVRKRTGSKVSVEMEPISPSPASSYKTHRRHQDIMQRAAKYKEDTLKRGQMIEQTRRSNQNQRIKEMANHVQRRIQYLQEERRKFEHKKKEREA